MGNLVAFRSQSDGAHVETYDAPEWLKRERPDIAAIPLRTAEQRIDAVAMLLSPTPEELELCRQFADLGRQLSSTWHRRANGFLYLKSAIKAANPHISPQELELFDAMAEKWDRRANSLTKVWNTAYELAKDAMRNWR